MYSKFNIKYIYDIFHNDNNKIIIIMPYEFEPPKIECINIKFEVHVCKHKHNHTIIYESLSESEYEKNIKILINSIEYNLKVNKYPEFKDEIIMSTMVHNEDNYIRQWIEFHFNIGVSRFIIYDNSKINDNKSYKSIEKSSNLKKILSDFIEKGIVLLIEWSFPKRLEISGISGQTTQQNHSIYAFRNSKYIGLFDIDEYVNMQNNTNIHNFFDKLIIDYEINTNNISGFQVKNKFFLNPYNLSTKKYDFFYRFICLCVSKKGHEKNFIIPKNVKIFAIHRVILGKPIYTVDYKYLYFNHYYFLNKSNRGKNSSFLRDNSILKHLNFIKS